MGATGGDFPIDEEDFHQLANRVGECESTAGAAERAAAEALETATAAMAEIERLREHIDETDVVIANLRAALGRRS